MIDSSAFIALFDKHDQYHKQAIDFRDNYLLKYDFSMYKESLEKLASCEAEICAFEHNGAVVGDQAKKVLHGGLDETERFKNRVIELYRQTGDLDETVQKVAAETFEKGKLEFMDAEFQVSVLRIMVINVLRYVELLDETTTP